MAIINPFMHFLPAVVGAYVLYKFILYLLGADEAPPAIASVPYG